MTILFHFANCAAPRHMALFLAFPNPEVSGMRPAVTPVHRASLFVAVGGKTFLDPFNIVHFGAG